MSTLDACYERHRPLLYGTVRKFQRRYGGEWQVLVAEANWYWLQAVRTWDPSRQPLGKRIHFCIWHGLLENLRTEQRHDRMLPREAIDMDEQQGQDPSRWQRLLDELSDDARDIVLLVIGPHLDSLLPGRMRKRQSNTGKVQDALAAFLLDAGWSGKEILRCFKEIQEVLA